MPVPSPIGSSPASPGASGSGGPAQLESLVKTIEQKLKDLVNTANAYFWQVDNTLGKIPGVGEAVTLLLDKLSGLVTSFVRSAAATLGQSHTATLMWTAGQTWGRIGTQTGYAAQAVHRLSDDTSDWGGLAGPPYTASAGNQYTAVSDYSGKANNLQSACYTVMGNALAFYGGVLTTVVGAIAGLAVGGPPGAVIGAVIGLCVTLANFVVQLIWANFSVATTISAQVKPDGTYDGPNPVGPVGGWPQGRS